MTITGTGFVKGATVRFGRAHGIHVRIVSTHRLTVKTPKHAKGVVDVTVTTAGGRSAKHKRDRFRFT